MVAPKGLVRSGAAATGASRRPLASAPPPPWGRALPHHPRSIPAAEPACRPLRASAAEAVPSPRRDDASGAKYLRSSGTFDDAAAAAANIPPFPRMTPEDERLAHDEGHFLRRLRDAGLVDIDGTITALGAMKVAPMDATYIHLTINKMLSMNRKYQTVIAVVRDVGPYMGAVNVATAMHRLGRLVRTARAWNPHLPERVVAHPQYQYLLRRVEEVVDDMAPRALANFLWGMAALGDTGSTGIVLRLGRRLMSIDPAQLKTQELSNVLWGMATLEVYEPALVDAILDSACERIDECVPQALSNMIWACATLRHRHPRFPAAVAASAAPRLPTFQSQTLANTLWAYSVLNIYPSNLFTNAADEIVRRLDAKRDGSNDASIAPPPAVDGDDPSASSFTEFRGQEISNVLIAYARGCIIHPPLLQALERELCRPVEVARDGQVVQVERLKEFTSQALANTLWAFATLRWYPARLLPAITEAVGTIVPSMTAQELANSLWAYARFAYHPGRVMATFLAVMERRVNEFEGQGCTNSLWALAVLKATHSAAFVGLLRRYVALERSSATFGELQYNQVLQAVLLAQFEARGGRVAWRPEVDLPESVVDRALAAWASQQMSTQLSGFHLDVSEGLTRLAVPHLLEHLVARDLLSIDIAVVEDGRRLAIEVDGPFHFPVNARTPLGHTMIRRRLLRAAGWTVLSIPWYEWFAMSSWEERLDYLTDMLSRADERFAHRLRPATKELLSTDFEPGPPAKPAAERNLDASAVTASGSFDEGEDGPVLSYYRPASGPNGALEADNGLMQVLSRSNVLLTTGAVRRLQSMGLDDVVKEVGERRKALGGSHASPDSYAPPPSVSASDGDPQLLPKPKLPRGRGGSGGGGGPRYDATRRPKRFSPRFVQHQEDGGSAWGYFPPAEEAAQKMAARRRSGAGRAPSRKRVAAEAGGDSGEATIQRVLRGKQETEADSSAAAAPPPPGDAQPLVD